MPFPLMGVLGAVVGPVLELGKLWFKKRQTIAEGQVRIEEAKVTGEIQRMLTSQEQEGQYNVAAQEGMKYSWKDEWLTMLWSMPFVLSFIPSTQMYVKDGFEMLRVNTPEWYQWGFLGILVASFGLKGWNFWTKKSE